MEEWHQIGAAAQGREIENGKIDPVDLTEYYLDRIDAHPLKDRIYARITPTRARTEAQAAQKRAAAGMRKSPLDGVPISWKDLIDSAGIPTEGGTKLLAGRTPAQDASVLATCTDMGLVCLGKTHLSELAFSGLGYNPMIATTPCVNDQQAVAGGSSSGAAGSVAFGLAAAAVGSDTGGSVRIPAAWNDLVGLKTSEHRISCAGVIPLCQRLDTIGPLTRTVEDAGLMLAAFEGGKAPPREQSDTLAGKRLLICKEMLDDLRDAPARAFEDAIKKLERSGAQIQTQKLSMTQEALALSWAIFAPEAYANWKDVIEAAPHKMFSEILKRFRGGAKVLATEYISAWHEIERLRAAYYHATQEYEAVIMPTSPIMPPNSERLGNDAQYYETENLLALRNTRIGNLLGVCALTLPTSVPSCGLMLYTPPQQEERLLQLGATVQRALKQ